MEGCRRVIGRSALPGPARSATLDPKKHANSTVSIRNETIITYNTYHKIQITICHARSACEELEIRGASSLCMGRISPRTDRRNLLVAIGRSPLL